MALTDEVKVYLESITQSVSKETADILSTVIGKDVVISVNTIKELDVNEVISTYPADILAVNFTISDKEEDTITVIFEKEIAVKISSWMMMESEEGVEFSEEHLDSIKETANQILGHLSSVLSEDLGRRLDFFSIRAEAVQLDPNFFTVPEPLSVEYSLNLGDGEEKKILQVLSSMTVENFQKGGEAEQEAPAESEGEPSVETPAEEGEVDEIGEEGEEPSLADAFPEEEESQLQAEQEAMIPVEEPGKIIMLMDISLPVTIELGRTRMLIKDILELGHGSVIEFDKLAGEPVDFLINEKKIAEGEVVVIDEHFGIRLTNLIKPADRIKHLGK